MNGRTYIIAKFFASLGIYRRTKRLTDAANEAHLLKQAEDLLGMDLWKNCEDVEGISTEYWLLRKQDQKRSELQARLDQANNELDLKTEEKAQILDETSEDSLAREGEYEALLLELDELNVTNAELVSRAHLVRRKIEASRMKSEVLGEGSQDSVEIEKEKTRLNSYKESFSALKVERDLVTAQITNVEWNIEFLEKLIAEDRAGLKGKAAAVFHGISEANRDASALASEMGLIDLDMQSNYSKIGHYISLNAGVDEASRKASKGQRGLINQMKSLRESITRNHQIAGIDSDR